MHTLERTMPLADGELFYRQQGTGTPLLLLHGLTGTGEDFQHLFALERLAETHCVIRPDARGHGRTTAGVADFSFRRCALDLLALLDHLQLDRVCAVGLSLGAMTLLQLAREAPLRVRSMVLVSAAPRLPEATRASFRAFAATPHGAAEWTAMRMQHVQGDAQIQALYELPAKFADDPADVCFSSDELRTMTAHTLIVTGDRDLLYPAELALELYRGIPSASLWVVPNAGHCPVFGERREAFERTTLSHFEEVAP